MKKSTLKPFKLTNLIFWGSLVGLLLVLFVYWRVYVAVRAIGQNNAALTAETATLEDQASKAGELKKSLATVQERQPVLASYFIDANDIVPFLETIEGYGRTTDVAVKFTMFTFKNSPDKLVVTLSAEGAFANLYHFMALLEAAPYQLNISSVNVMELGSVAQDPKLKVVPVRTWQALISVDVTSITGVPALGAGK